jgi:chromosome segregation ATPase
MADPNGNGKGISVQTLGSMMVVIFMALGGVYGVFQTQFSGIEREIQDAKTAVDLQRANLAHINDEQTANIAKIQDTFRQDLSNVLVSKNQFDEFKQRFDSLDARVLAMTAEINQIEKEAAHHPVEQETIAAIDSDFSKRIDILQVEIQDINRQIAAALIIIDSNSAAPRRQGLPQDSTPK